jgi:hypothetical protein
LVYDEVFVDRSGIVDLPNVVVDENDASVRILGSGMWSEMKSIASIFFGIISHESIHLTLLRIDGSSSDYLDNVASLSGTPEGPRFRSGPNPLNSEDDHKLELAVEKPFKKTL